MGAKKNILYLLTVLSAINFLTAQEGSGYYGEFVSSDDDTSGDSSESHEDRQAGFPFGMNGPSGSLGGLFGMFGMPTGLFGNPGGVLGNNPLGSFFGGQSGIFGQPGSLFGGQSGQQGGLSTWPSGDFSGGQAGQSGDLFSGQSSRQHPHFGHHGEGPDGPNDRFFFSFPTVTACNYTTRPGRSCLSCTQSLRCLSNNVGYLKRCKGLFPYCNNGRCSIFRGPLCTSTTTPAATQTPTPTPGGTT